MRVLLYLFALTVVVIGTFWASTNTLLPLTWLGVFALLPIFSLTGAASQKAHTVLTAAVCLNILGAAILSNQSTDFGISHLVFVCVLAFVYFSALRNTEVLRPVEQFVCKILRPFLR